jgi:L-asparaginase
MKKIALIYMGGTFGCIGKPLSPMPAHDFIPKLKKVLPIHLNIECFIAPVIKDSSACTPSDWLKLIQFIQNLQLQNFQHFVIIHGTDTLSYVSAILAQCLGQSAYVVLTGSQYPLLTVDAQNTREFTDALENLNFALDSIMHVSVGVYLAFHHQLIHAQTTLKRHTTDLNAFTGILAQNSISSIEHVLIVKDSHIEKAKQFNCQNWMLQPSDPSALLFNLNNLLSHPPSCLILQGFGTGNISTNTEIIDILQKFKEKNCPVILTTQVPFGSIDQRYAVSQWIQTSKILVSNALSHADLYAKSLKMYLKYDTVDQWIEHWND